MQKFQKIALYSSDEVYHRLRIQKDYHRGHLLPEDFITEYLSREETHVVKIRLIQYFNSERKSIYRVSFRGSLKVDINLMTLNLTNQCFNPGRSVETELQSMVDVTWGQKRDTMRGSFHNRTIRSSAVGKRSIHHSCCHNK